MPVLAFDTSLGAVSVAAGRRDIAGNWSMHGAWEQCRSGHAERLLPMIASVLADAGLSPRDVRRVAVTLGPGTFTGVRTGVAVARAYALTAGAEVVGISSLAAMAAAVGSDVRRSAAQQPIAIAVDARRGELYVELFDAAGGVLKGPELLSVAAAAERLAGATWRVAGSAAGVLAEAAAKLGTTITWLDATLEPDAGHLVGLAEVLPPLTSVAPLYLKPPDALPQAGKSLPRRPS